MLARTSRGFGRVHIAWRLWALSVVLGIVGMHGLTVGLGAGEHVVVASAAAVHQTTSVASAIAPMSSAPSHDAHSGDVHRDHDPAQPPTPVTTHHGGDDESGMALCMALLLVFAVAVLRRRRVTWVSVLVRETFARSVCQAPDVLARTPMTRFTVMRC